MRRYYYIKFCFLDDRNKFTVTENFSREDLAIERAIELLQEGVKSLEFNYKELKFEE